MGIGVIPQKGWRSTLQWNQYPYCFTINGSHDSSPPLPTPLSCVIHKEVVSAIGWSLLHRGKCNPSKQFKFRGAGYQTEQGVKFINTRLLRLKPLINVLHCAVSVDVSSIALYSTLLNFIKLLTSKVWSTSALAMEVPTQTIKWRGSPSTCSVRPTFPLVSCKAVEKKRYYKIFHR